MMQFPSVPGPEAGPENRDSWEMAHLGEEYPLIPEACTPRAPWHSHPDHVRAYFSVLSCLLKNPKYTDTEIRL